MLESGKPINSFLNISIGDSDLTEQNFTRGIKVLDTIINKTKNEGLKYRIEYLKNTNHSTSPFKEIPIALLEFSKILKKPNESELQNMLNNKLSFSEQIKSYYSKISNWIGYSFLPSENEINSLSYFCLSNKNPKEGLNIINWAIEIYPNAINLYDSKAELLENLNQKQEVINTSKFALIKLEKMNLGADDLKYYKEMLEKHLIKD